MAAEAESAGRARLLLIGDGGRLTRTAALLSPALLVEADVVQDGMAGCDLAARRRHDAIILDLPSGPLDNVAVCSRLRAAGIPTPIVVLTTDTTPAGVVAALDAGADICIGVPVAAVELQARLRALLRRLSWAHGPDAGAQ